MSDNEEAKDQPGEEEPPKEIEEPDVDQDDFYPSEDSLITKVQDIIKKGLNKIGKTFDGSAYSYVELNCEQKNLINLYAVMKSYPHLRKISFAKNKIQDVSTLTWIPYLTHLDLRANQIKDLSCFNVLGSLQFLVDLNLSNNHIEHLVNIVAPRLIKLNLTANKIHTCESFTGHPSIKILDLSKNKLKSVQGVQNMQNLNELYLADNELIGFGELNNLPQLKILHLRKNQIVSFTVVPNLPLLNHLNVRENQIAQIEDIRALLQLPVLMSLTAHQSPLSEEKGDSMKKEVVMILQQIVRVNKEEVTAEERMDAINELKDRMAELERKRKEDEDERIRLAEEEQAKLVEEARLLEEAKQLAEDARILELENEEARLLAAKQDQDNKQIDNDE